MASSAGFKTKYYFYSVAPNAWKIFTWLEKGNKSVSYWDASCIDPIPLALTHKMWTVLSHIIFFKPCLVIGSMKYLAFFAFLLSSKIDGLFVLIVVLVNIGILENIEGCSLKRGGSIWVPIFLDALGAFVFICVGGKQLFSCLISMGLKHLESQPPSNLFCS